MYIKLNMFIAILTGPACQEIEKLKEMIYSGMNIARMNFSHGTYEVNILSLVLFVY